MLFNTNRTPSYSPSPLLPIPACRTITARRTHVTLAAVLKNNLYLYLITVTVTERGGFAERVYQCLGQWTESQQNGPGETSARLTYTFVKRVDSPRPEYECFVATTVPNDPGRDPATTTTLLLTEAGTGNRCSRMADPFKSGMKLIGTRVGQGTVFDSPLSIAVQKKYFF